MKKIFDYFFMLVVALATTMTLVCCDDEIETDPEATPILSSVTVNDSLISQTTASIDVEFADLAELNYSYYLTSDEESAVDTIVEIEEGATAYTIELTELTAESDYTISVIGVAASGEQTAAINKTFTTLETYKPAVTKAEIVAGTITENAASIAVTVADADQLFYTIAAENESASDAIEVAIVDNAAVVALTELADTTTYTVVFYATFENGLYKSTEVEVVFTTLAIEQVEPEDDASYTVSNLQVTPTSATIDLAIGEDCEGLIVYADNSEWFNVASITDMITNGYATVITESCTYTMGSYYTPGTTCKYIVVEVSDVETTTNEWGMEATTCTLVGELDDYEVYEFTTGQFDMDYVVNNATSNTVKINSNTPDYTQITIEVTRDGDEEIKSVYCGAVATADLAGTTIGEYLVNNNWFASAYASDFVNEYSGTIDPLSTTIYNLTADTEYTLFTVPVTTSGKIGTITTEATQTKSVNIVVDETLMPTITIVPGLNSVEITIDFGDCAKVFYEYEDKYYSSDYETAKSTIYANVLNNSYVFDSQYYPSPYTHTISGLDQSTEYKFWCMGVKADGTYGAVCEYTYTTTGLDWTGTTTAVVTQVSGTIDEYGFADVVFSVDLSDDTTKATLAVVDPEYIYYDIPANWGKYILENTWNNQYLTADGNITVTLYNSNYKLVVVTENANGVYGTPLVLDVDWDALTPYVSE